jgi:hypothetical protein
MKKCGHKVTAVFCNTMKLKINLSRFWIYYHLNIILEKIVQQAKSRKSAFVPLIRLYFWYCSKVYASTLSRRFIIFHHIAPKSFKAPGIKFKALSSLLRSARRPWHETRHSGQRQRFQVVEGGVQNLGNTTHSLLDRTIYLCTLHVVLKFYSL